jgi:hypothetical protein
MAFNLGFPKHANASVDLCVIIGFLALCSWRVSYRQSNGEMEKKGLRHAVP